MPKEILVINPGSTSTKIGWYSDLEERWSETVSHSPSEIGSFPTVASQYHFRMDTIERVLKDKGFSPDGLDGVVGRGGIIDPIPGGTYEVDQVLLERLKSGRPWEHASNLGGILAYAIGSKRAIPAMIVDPVSVDELWDVARLTGIPELAKISLNHALNVKATVRRCSRELGLDWTKENFIVVHLGGGLTICAHHEGRIVDFNSGNDFGPFSPERAGGLPADQLVKLCFNGGLTISQMKKKLTGQGGVMAYLGTKDMKEVSKKASEGDGKAILVRKAMAYGVSCSIGSMASALSGKVRGIIFTGGISNDSLFVSSIQQKVQWIAPAFVYPGEGEMKALAEGALRVLTGEEKAKSYGDTIKRGMV